MEVLGGGWREAVRKVWRAFMFGELGDGRGRECGAAAILHYDDSAVLLTAAITKTRSRQPNSCSRTAAGHSTASRKGRMECTNGRIKLAWDTFLLSFSCFCRHGRCMQCHELGHAMVVA